MRTLGIILARGGSKRLPHKNKRLMGDKALIYYTIKCALDSYITDVFVSSDDKEILSISKKYGAQIIKRPKELAEDDTPSLVSFKHAIKEAEKLYGDKCYDKVVLLQPTSPTRTIQMINRSIYVNSDVCITVENAYHGMKNATFIENGAVYVLRREIVEKIEPKSKYMIDDILREKFAICCIVTEHCEDIDSEEQFKRVEAELCHTSS